MNDTTKEKKEAFLLFRRIEQEVYKQDLLELCRFIGFNDLQDPGIHRDLERFLKRSGQYKLCMLPRGHLKTSIASVAETIQDIIKNPNIRILLSSSSWNNARTFLTSIIEVLESKKFCELFGDMRGNKWNQDEILVKGRTKVLKESTVTTTGMERTITSQHYDKIKFDDLVSRENIGTKEMREKTKVYYRDCLDLLEPGVSQVLVLGTMWDYDDLYSYIRKDLKGYFKIMVRAVEENGIIIYPMKFNQGRRDELKKQKGTYSFYCQYYNKAVDDDNADFKHSWIQYYGDMDLYDRDANQKITKKPLTVNMTLDPALSEKSEDDPSGFVVWGIDILGKIYYLHCEKGMLNPTQLISRIIKLHMRWKPNKFAVESVGFQKVLKFNLNAEFQRLGYRFPVILLSPGKVDKDTRIRGLIPFFENKDVFIKREMTDLEDELIHFPRGGENHLLDASAMQLELLRRPTIEEDEKKYDFSPTGKGTDPFMENQQSISKGYGAISEMEKEETEQN